MGYREYARHRGCTLKAVQRALASERIFALPGKKIDSEAADQRWAACTDPAKAPPPAVSAPAPMPLLDGKPEDGAVAMRRPEWPEWPNWKPAERKQEVGLPANVIGMDTFLAAKTERERAEAEMAKIALAEKRKQLVSADQTRQTFRAIGRMFAAAREQVPAQLAAQLVGKTDLNEIEAVVRTALRETDTRIANEIASRFGDAV
jgi:hypothetical protein